MNTTELIELLKSVEFGASGKPREISISYNSGEIFFPKPDIIISGTGDGVAGAELSLELIGEVWIEEEEKMKYDKGDKVKIDGVIREIENITQWDKDTQRYKFVGVIGWHEIKEGPEVE